MKSKSKNFNKGIKNKEMIKNVSSKNFNLMLIVTFFMGVVLIFSAYAWFYASLDVQVKFINLVVSRKNGLFISLDGIDFGSSVQISKANLIDNLKNTYPNNTSQWSDRGLYPISSLGIPDSNTEKLDFYYSTAFEIDEINKKRYLTTRKSVENGVSSRKNYIAFDLFLKNITGSPVSDNLYIDEGTNIIVDESGNTEQIEALINTARIGFVKIGTVSNEATVDEIQNIQCNNDCRLAIYEPNATKHTQFSIEKARKYDITVLNGQYHPTLAIAGEMDFFEISDVLKGYPNENFKLQETTFNINNPIFELPDGITKIRVYVWLEGQDVDAIETKSEGADVSVIINLIKDTAGYDAFNE